MRMLCDRLSALTAGAMVGVWYAKNFPCEESTGDNKDKGKDKGKDKSKDKGSDSGKEKEKEKGKDKG
ncbi:splicing regulatory glutamine/lysine-rich protein 1 isoform X2 [Drosophila rhopaloa]|uniref:Splicing regulatory glutamine/lysine-rich protein 1 isoform X2 n=1 Tax=Drosophila rhopaloa TaxID=1041015 RepID=A0A6P4EYG0_DRORH|nr:splicing regulatory glutamine/lysine-rich protein 1 isoform X2 [Drosophila rhopaloa]XP_016983190.1 splicing regulatory glutamine/lysine-rich protein 1 isoform X2 [Drosophila rhopaloa]